MTVDDCRTILKVHIKSKESIGAIGSAFALLEVLTAVDAQLAEEQGPSEIQLLQDRIAYLEKLCGIRSGE